MSASREKNKRKELNASAEAPATPAKKGMSKGLKWTIGIICLVLVIAIVTFFSMLTSGYLAGHTTAATVGSHKLSPAMVNYFYKEAYNSMSSQYGDMMSYIIDSNTPLNEQYYDEENGITWADTLIEQGLTSAARVYAIYDEAVANGETLSDDDQSSIDATVSNLSVYATYYGYSNVNGYLAAMYGTGCNEKNFREFLSIETLANNYSQKVYDTPVYTEDELAADYAADPNAYDTVDYRVFAVTDALFDEEDEEKLADLKKTAADELLAAAEEGDEAFIQAAYDHASEDTKENYEDDSYTLRTDVGHSDSDLSNWLFESDRKTGDATCVETSGTYYVAIFESRDTHDYALPNARHILISVSDTTDEEAMATAKETAEKLLAEYEAGEHTEDAFAAIGDDAYADGTAAESARYEDITPGQMVEDFENWCFDASRQVGDTGIVESTYGYHVMYFSGFGTNYRMKLVEDEQRGNVYTDWLTATTENASYETVASGMRFVTK